MHGEIDKKEMIKIIMKRQVFFPPSWVLEWFFCLAYGENAFLRSDHQDVFYKKRVLRNFAKFTGKHRARVSLLIKLQAACNFIKKEILARCFPVDFKKFLKHFFLQNTRWLLLLLHLLSSFYYVTCSWRKTFKLT